MSQTQTSAEALAVKFSETLTEWLGPKDLEKFVLRNKEEKDSWICHSHDFCDANMAMFESVQALGLNDDLNNPETIKLMNEAWELAKASGFDFKKAE